MARSPALQGGAQVQGGSPPHVPSWVGRLAVKGAPVSFQTPGRKLNSVGSKLSRQESFCKVQTEL